MTSAQSTSLKLIMGQQAPALKVDTLVGTQWILADQTPERFTMAVFYRGLHCPICQQYLTDLDQRLDRFRQLGVEAIAISGDTQDAAQQLKIQTHLKSLTIGYGLMPEDMKRWGLYLSQGYFENEPILFSEPAVFLIKSNRQLYMANIGTHPFSRIDFEFLLKGLEYVLSQDYPIRGTQSGSTAS